MARYWLRISVADVPTTRMGTRSIPNGCPGCGGAMEDRVERRQLFQGGFRTKREAQRALIDALSPLGVTAIDMPATSEKVWRLIHGRPPARS
jgi:hypothetical protein